MLKIISYILLYSFLKFFILYRTRNGNNETALHLASKSGHLHVAKALINAKGHTRRREILNCKDHRGNTPLHHCVLNGNYELAKILVKSGADLSMKNVSGKTAREEAIDMNHLAVLTLLKNDSTSVII